MTQAKTIRIRWLGPARAIPDLGLRVKPGDIVEIPKDTQLPGEGDLWEKARKPRTQEA